ncbi:toxin-antitoxin system HicB family antitoxin [Luteolibacter sp. Populi]|uniref:toxin-antitoxin system HicB family antitoxin n=1 Tax=Luteolibacter sp. Populi TaxID=3230487 RepID=UPI0034660150
MSALTVRLPESLHNHIRELAKKEGYSVNQFLATAAAEKLAALMTVDYLKAEAALANRKDFEDFLSAVPHQAPEPGDA